MSDRSGPSLITDHAVLRYLERRHGIRTDLIRAELLAEGRAALVQKMRYGKVHCPGLGVVLQVRDGVVVTVKSPPLPKSVVTRQPVRPKRAR